MDEWSEAFDSTIAPPARKKGKGKGSNLTCLDCGLDRTCHHPKMEAHGKGEKDVLWVGEAPGEQEDEVGKQWQGRVGKALRSTLLRQFDFDLFRDAVCINSVNCRPPDNRPPEPVEIACCRQNVLKVIEEMKPKLIVLAGGSAVESLIGNRWKEVIKIGQWRGWNIPDRDYNAWVCPVFHQSYVERSKADLPQVETIYLQDLERALSCLDRPISKYRNEADCIQIIRDQDELSVKLLDLLHEPPAKISFDFETTGLKPYVEGHKIVCVGVAYGRNLGFVFPAPLPDSKNMLKFKKLLEHPKIKKMAHNIQFEDTWSRVILGANVEPWLWDSMMAAHILDNRSKVTGLKFQAYVQFGIADYNSSIQPFLEGTGKSVNSFNTIMDLINKVPHGEDKLLKYCGMDALLEYRLADLQMKLQEEKQPEFEYRTQMHEGGS